MKDIPNIAHHLVENVPELPLKGIAVGNGCTGNEVGSCGGQRTQYDAEYLLGTAFLPKALKDAIRAECPANWTHPSAPCAAALAKVNCPAASFRQ